MTEKKWMIRNGSLWKHDYEKMFPFQPCTGVLCTYRLHVDSLLITKHTQESNEARTGHTQIYHAIHSNTWNNINLFEVIAEYQMISLQGSCLCFEQTERQTERQTDRGKNKFVWTRRISIWYLCLYYPVMLKRTKFQKINNDSIIIVIISVQVSEPIKLASELIRMPSCTNHCFDYILSHYNKVTCPFCVYYS